MQDDLQVPNPELQPVKPRERIYWLDFAKSYGMFLVFLGHILEAYWLNGYAAAFVPYKFIYSFHIPLFFMLSGYVSRDSDLDFYTYLRTKLFPRLIIPFIFFNCSFILIEFSRDIVSGSLDFSSLAQALWELMMGQPSNVVTWFLLCLFWVKVIDYAITSRITSQPVKLVAAVATLSF